MNKTLTCLTLWAAMSAISVSADNAVAPPPTPTPVQASSKCWSASISADLAGKNLTVTNRIRSSIPEDIWSKTTESKRSMSPGITLQGTLNIPNTKFYTGLEFSYTFGGLKVKTNRYELIALDRNMDSIRRMSHMMQGGVLLGYNFADFSLHAKAGFARFQVVHESYFNNGTGNNLSYKKKVPGYYVGVGYTREITKSFAVGVDYEYATYKTEKKAFYHTGVGPREDGFFKSQSKIDTLKLRFIYKI